MSLEPSRHKWKPVPPEQVQAFRDNVAHWKTAMPELNAVLFSVEDRFPGAFTSVDSSYGEPSRPDEGDSARILLSVPTTDLGPASLLDKDLLKSPEVEFNNDYLDLSYYVDVSMSVQAVAAMMQGDLAKLPTKAEESSSDVKLRDYAKSDALAGESLARAFEGLPKLRDYRKSENLLAQSIALSPEDVDRILREHVERETGRQVESITFDVKTDVVPSGIGDYEEQSFSGATLRFLDQA